VGSAVASEPAIVVLECRGSGETLDRVAVPAGTLWVRLRDDRALLVEVSANEVAPSPELIGRLREAHPSVIVIDVSPGWFALSLADDLGPALASLTAMWPATRPDRARAGSIAGVPGLVVPTVDGVLVLVGASHGHHLRALLDGPRSPGPGGAHPVPMRPEATRA
jgi:hypothetical protein